MPLKTHRSSALRAALCTASMIVSVAIPAGAFAAAVMVPENLQPAPTQKLALEANAAGVQIYTCSAAKSGEGKTEWVLKAPEATLYDAAGNKLARHYAGPTWESVDGSKVVGKLKSSATPSDSAIAWLLLDVKSTEGNGVFSKITAVQRVATEDGKAPADGCSHAGLGKEVRIPYKAVYRFFTAG
ncbi:MAG TPA: DUF3455 domain-containing protein [Janthinobacterium sp.]|nr:DUF3455 domain-containing protein [Janthinobacterium sp.]